MNQSKLKANACSEWVTMVLVLFLIEWEGGRGFLHWLLTIVMQNPRKIPGTFNVQMKTEVLEKLASTLTSNLNCMDTPSASHDFIKWMRLTLFDCLIVVLQLALVTHYWTWLSHVATWGSIILFFLTTITFNSETWLVQSSVTCKLGRDVCSWWSLL